MSQRAMDGGVTMSRDGRTGICSCNTCTSAVHGGRMSQRATDGGVARAAPPVGADFLHSANQPNKNPHTMFDMDGGVVQVLAAEFFY